MMNEEHLRYNLSYYALPEDFIPDDILYGLGKEAPTSCEDYIIGDIALSTPLVPLTSEMPQQLKLTIDSDIDAYCCTIFVRFDIIIYRSHLHSIRSNTYLKHQKCVRDWFG